jgi:hypothetical protein
VEGRTAKDELMAKIERLEREIKEKEESETPRPKAGEFHFNMKHIFAYH